MEKEAKKQTVLESMCVCVCAAAAAGVMDMLEDCENDI